MVSIKLPIHSFVDLITNSSTEIFVEATEKTVKTLKELIDELLLVGGSTLKSDDLFTFKLETSCPCVDEGYYDEEAEECSPEDHVKECSSAITSMVVTAKKEIPNLEQSVKLLNNLRGLFDYRERSN